MKQIRNIGFVFLLLMCVWPAGAQDEGVMKEGMAAFQQKEYGRAATLFSEALRHHPQDADLWLWRGKALFFHGDEAAARAVFNEADRLRPGYASLWLARLYAWQGEEDEAFRALQQHLASPYHRPLREIMLDTLLTPLERDPRWREIWKKDWYSRREQAEAAIRGDLVLDDPEAALQEANTILAQYNDNAVLLALRARARLAQGDLHGAADDLAQATAINAEDTTVLMTGVMIAREKGDPQATAKVCERLYEQRPGDFALLLRAAAAWKEAGETEKAITAVEHYRKYFPDEPRAMLQAGELYASQGEYHRALRLLSQVIEKDPGDPYNFVTRGDVYMKAHTYRYAIFDYGMALDLDPSNGEVYYRRGKAYLKTGDRESACFDFSRALHYGRKKAIIYLQKYCGK